MAWHDAPRKPNGVDKLKAQQASTEAFALKQGWGPLLFVGETRDQVVFNFADHQVFWTPDKD
jgi:hypothetical protein